MELNIINMILNFYFAIRGYICFYMNLKVIIWYPYGQITCMTRPKKKQKKLKTDFFRIEKWLANNESQEVFLCVRLHP